MMSRNVRRLVFDFAPHYQNGIGLLLWALIAFLTALWMAGKGSPNIMMLFSASIATLSYMVKIPVWRTLPISQAELGQTQWWHLFGRPIVFVLVSFVLALVVVAVFGGLAVSATDVLAYAAAEVFMVAIIGIGPLLGMWLKKPFKAVGYFTGLFAPYLAAFVIGIRWTDKEAFRSYHMEMFLVGACAVLIILLTGLFSPWLPLVKPSTSRPGSARNQSDSQTAPRPSGITGWRVLVKTTASITLKTLFIFAGLGALAMLAARHRMLTITEHDLAWFFLLMPLLALLITMVFAQLIPYRLLGGLPLTPWQRALAIHVVAPAIQLTSLMIVCAFMMFMDRGALTLTWFIRYGFVVLCVIAYGALAQPFAMRFGRQGAAFFTGIIAAQSGIVGALISANSRGEPHVFGFDVRMTMLLLVIVMTVVLVASWLWTWLELKYGRAAYRHQPVVLLNWRGQGG